MLTFLGKVKIRKGGEWGEKEGWRERGSSDKEAPSCNTLIQNPRDSLSLSPVSIYGPVQADRPRMEHIWR